MSPAFSPFPPSAQARNRPDPTRKPTRPDQITQISHPLPISRSHALSLSLSNADPSSSLCDSSSNPRRPSPPSCRRPALLLHASSHRRAAALFPNWGLEEKAPIRKFGAEFAPSIFRRFTPVHHLRRPSGFAVGQSLPITAPWLVCCGEVANPDASLRLQSRIVRRREFSPVTAPRRRCCRRRNRAQLCPSSVRLGNATSKALLLRLRSSLSAGSSFCRRGYGLDGGSNSLLS